MDLRTSEDGFELITMYRDSVIIPWPFCRNILESQKSHLIRPLNIGEAPQHVLENIEKNLINTLDYLFKLISCSHDFVKSFKSYKEVDVVEAFFTSLKNNRLFFCSGNPLVPGLHFSLRSSEDFVIRFDDKIFLEWLTYESTTHYHTCRFIPLAEGFAGWCFLLKYSKNSSKSCSDLDGSAISFPVDRPEDVIKMFVMRLPKEKEDIKHYVHKLKDEKDLYFTYDPEDPPRLSYIEVDFGAGLRH